MCTQETVVSWVMQKRRTFSEGGGECFPGGKVQRRKDKCFFLGGGREGVQRRRRIQTNVRLGKGRK
jgi:hypothetical protein